MKPTKKPTRKTVEYWSITIKWSHKKKEEQIADFPNFVADAVDQYLTELENEENEDETCPNCGSNDTWTNSSDELQCDNCGFDESND